jgi:hypothetical protein
MSNHLQPVTSVTMSLVCFGAASVTMCLVTKEFTSKALKQRRERRRQRSLMKEHLKISKEDVEIFA